MRGIYPAYTGPGTIISSPGSMIHRNDVSKASLAPLVMMISSSASYSMLYRLLRKLATASRASIKPLLCE